MDEKLASELKEAEAAVIETEKKLGPDHPDLADKLQRYANLLRQTEKRALDAVNVEARARAIRAKMYAADEQAHGTTTKLSKNKSIISNTAPPVGMYFGLAGIAAALVSLVVTQTALVYLLVLAAVLAVADVVISRSGFWRIALVVVFGVASLLANQSLPTTILTEDTPLARYTYSTQDPELVSNVGELGKPQTVLSYSVCLPKGFTAVGDSKEDWGRVITFQPQETQSTNPSKFMLMLIKLPADTKPSARVALLKIAADVAIPQVASVLSLSDVQQENPREVEINGLDYAKIGFSGTSSSGVRNGFAYVAENNKSLLVLAAGDSVTDAQETLPKMDASVYTLRKLKNGDDLDSEPVVAGHGTQQEPAPTPQ